MNKALKIALVVVAAFVALTVLFNLLPADLRVAATLCAAGGTVAGALAGWKACRWWNAIAGR